MARRLLRALLDPIVGLSSALTILAVAFIGLRLRIETGELGRGWRVVCACGLAADVCERGATSALAAARVNDLRAPRGRRRCSSTLQRCYVAAGERSELCGLLHTLAQSLYMLTERVDVVGAHLLCVCRRFMYARSPAGDSAMPLGFRVRGETRRILKCRRRGQGRIGPVCRLALTGSVPAAPRRRGISTHRRRRAPDTATPSTQANNKAAQSPEIQPFGTPLPASLSISVDGAVRS